MSYVVFCFKIKPHHCISSVLLLIPYFRQIATGKEALPITVSCEKCMPYGQYITVARVNLAGTDPALRITEFAIYGHEIDL